MKVFERAIRRANIPIAMSKGFNPHPKLSLPLALSVGIIGKDEVLELELLDPVSSAPLAESLGSQLPKEIQILSVEVMPPSTKNPVRDVTYEIMFKESGLLETLKIGEFLQQSSVMVIRTKDGCQKSFDIRPSVQEISVTPASLVLSIRMTSEGIAKPEEVVRALCGSEKKELFEIIRTKVNLFSAA